MCKKGMDAAEWLDKHSVIIAFRFGEEQARDEEEKDDDEKIVDVLP